MCPRCWPFTDLLDVIADDCKNINHWLLHSWSVRQECCQFQLVFTSFECFDGCFYFIVWWFLILCWTGVNSVVVVVQVWAVVCLSLRYVLLWDSFHLCLGWWGLLGLLGPSQFGTFLFLYQNVLNFWILFLNPGFFGFFQALPDFIFFFFCQFLCMLQLLQEYTYSSLLCWTSE